MPYEKLFEESDFDSLLQIADSVDLNNGIEGIRANLWKGKALWALGRLNEAQKVLEKTLNKLEEEKKLDTEKLSMKADILNSIANCYIYQNYLEPVLDYYQATLEIYNELNDRAKIARCLNNLAVFYHTTGDFRKCLNYLKRTLEMYQEIEDNYGILGAYYNLAGLYLDMGEIKQAKFYLEKSEQFAQMLDNILYKASTANLYGTYYFLQGMIKEAVKSLTEAKRLYHNLGNTRFIATNYHKLIVALMADDKKEAAKEILSDLEKISQSENNSKIEIAYKLSKAKFLQSSHRLLDKGKATMIYEEIMDSDLMEIKLDAIEGLIELLLDELYLTNNTDTLNQISELMEQYVDIAQDNHLYVRIIRILVFKSRFMIIMGNLDVAEQLLLQAQTYAAEKDLVEAGNWADFHFKEFNKHIDKWKNIVNAQFEITERMHQTQIRKYIDYLSRFNKSQS